MKKQNKEEPINTTLADALEKLNSINKWNYLHSSFHGNRHTDYVRQISA